MGGPRSVREPFNTWSHAAGAVGVLVATVWLVATVRIAHDQWALLTYGCSVALMFSSSAAYHAATRHVERLQRLDHASIAIAIFGTYAALCWAAWSGPGRWMLFVESVLLVVSVVNSLVRQSNRSVRLVVFAFMGWLALLAWQPLGRSLGPLSLAWILTGGVVYTLGMVVYASKWPDPSPDWLGSHGVWHLFVLAGAACHFVGISQVYLSR